MVRGSTEWSTAMLVDSGDLVMHTTMVSCLERDWGVYPTLPFQRQDAKRHRSTSRFFTVQGDSRQGIADTLLHS